MVKKIATLSLIGVILMFGFSGCFGAKYSVDYGGNKAQFGGARDRYRAGAEVILYYKNIATDADYTFYVDGARVNAHYREDKGYIIAFTMPAHDISVRVDVKNSMVYVGESDKNAELSFHSFDGGGPKYTVKIDDEKIVTCEQANRYRGKKDPTASGTPYTVEIVFTGLKAGTTTARIEARSPTGIRYDEIYDITVDADLKVTATLRKHIEGGEK